MMKNHLLKSYLLIMAVVLSDCHSLFKGAMYRVDWFVFIEHTRRIDYAIMYLCKHLIYIILSYCILYPQNINKDLKRFIFVATIFDLIHYLTTSHIGFPFVKLLASLLVVYIYKKIKE